MAREWLDSCAKHHRHSCPITQDLPLPTRVVDVSGDPQMPRLVATQRRPGEWVALSHCWGKQLHLVTKAANLEQMQQGIRFEDLPPTFQDAITVTRRLCYRYIWIDSLCIVQDSKDDWAAESLQMQHYYKDSVLTIAADDTTGDHEGFLATARKPERVVARIPFQTQLTRKLCYASIRLDVEYTGQETESTYLSERAWTLQEDLLAPRTLHFGSQYLAWECQGHRITEKDLTPRGADESDALNITKRFFLHPEASESCALVQAYPSMASYFEPLARWYNILEEYCKRDLTYDKDRLLAILGFAQEVEMQTKMTYLSGLWLEDLHFGLLWQIDGRGIRHEAMYKQPSWNWASLKVEHTWGRDTNPLVQIYYGARQLELDREASFRVEVLNIKQAGVEDITSGIDCCSHSLRLRGQTVPLADWATKGRTFFRSYWRPPLSHGGWYLWEKAKEDNMLICSFDEDPEPQSDTDHGSEDETGDEEQQSNEDDGFTWNQDALEDVLML